MPTRESPPAHPGRGREQLLLELLRINGPLSRSRLQDLSGLSRTTLYDTVAKLVDGGAVVVSRSDAARRGRGRPVDELALHPRAQGTSPRRRPFRAGHRAPNDEGERH